ncbi:MAG: hypothetical protein ACREIT_06300, partial [Tepidisphaeraceae bacterium]
FGVEELAGLPTLLARRSAARWLRVRDCPPAGVTTGVVDRLILMAADAASPSRQDFPGGVSVRRRGGRISS